jgi:predicted nucleotidyltransferase
MNDRKAAKDLQSAFAHHPMILAAYLFGSVAHQTAGANSDVDIAVRLDPGLSAGQQLDLRLKLMDEMEECFDRPADIVVLNTASLKMIRQVLTTGKLLYARDMEAEHLYAIKKRKEYFDFKYFIEKDSRELRSFYGVT